MISFIPLLKKIYHAFPAPPSTNYLYQKFKVNPYSLLPSDPIIFDIGSKNAKGNYAFGNLPLGAELVCVDLEPGDGVDLVADAHDLYMVSDNSVDCVLCISLLEHVYNPARVMKEIHRILHPGGIVYINVPFVYPFHADPQDFYRFSSEGIALLCEEFECLDYGFNRGPASTMHHLLVRFCAMVFCFNNETLYGINIDIFGWLFFWMKYLDKFLAHYQMAYVIHSGSYFIGRKA